MMKIKIICLFLLVFPGVVSAWNFDAHHLIAEIAYQNLQPKVRKRVLKHVYTLAKFYPYTGFAKSASWADRIRFHDVDAFSQWHFIDTPFMHDGLKAPSVEKQNIVWAINQAEQVLKSRQSNSFEKALFLRFYIHLVGDIHQPLHCVSYYSKRFPRGDRGGNLYSVNYQGYQSNLHVIWDRGGGLLEDNITHKRGRYWNSIKKLAKRLQKKHPQQGFERELATEPSHWANESYDLARDKAYQVDVKSTLSEAYLKQVQEVSAKQITLAGYRLAYRLNQIFA